MLLLRLLTGLDFRDQLMSRYQTTATVNRLCLYYYKAMLLLTVYGVLCVIILQEHTWVSATLHHCRTTRNIYGSSTDTICKVNCI